MSFMFPPELTPSNDVILSAREVVGKVYGFAAAQDLPVTDLFELAEMILRAEEDERGGW